MSWPKLLVREKIYMVQREKSGDVVFIQGIRCRGPHGVSEGERRQGNDFLVDVRLEMDISLSCTTDDLAATADYREIHALVLRWVEQKSFRLLEALADGLAKELLAQFRPFAVAVRIEKLQPWLRGIAHSVGVEVYRYKDSG